MNNRHGLRANVAVCVNVSHNIVAQFALILFRRVVIYVVNMRFKFGNLFVRDVETEFFLTFRKCNPEFAPGGKLGVIGENLFHLIA